MINSIKEIEERYEAIKDNSSRGSKKLNELGDILASAYLIDPHRANDMWQYIINLNMNNDIKNTYFYVAQVFNKIRARVSEEDATFLYQ